MSLVVDSPPGVVSALTLQDLADRFGPMLPTRIRFEPSPGSATEADLVRILDSEDRLYELVDGTLVEKTVAFEESELAAWLIVVLSNFIGPRKLGLLTTPDGPYRLGTGLIRLPDVAFVARARFPGGKCPRGAICDVVPNLVVEILSPGNTPAEMRGKLAEYFRAGVELVWLVDHRRRTCEVFTSPSEHLLLVDVQTLTGGAVLPGFELALRDLFSCLDDD